MASELATFEQSLGDLDGGFVTVPPADLAAAVQEFVVGPAVGIPDAAWPESLPPTVDWEPTPAALEEARTGVTPAAFAIADYGSVVLPTEPPATELVSLHVDRHVAVLDAEDLVPDMPAAFDRLDDEVLFEYRDAIIATGPSATADMGALVTGAHGPSEVRVVVVGEG